MITDLGRLPEAADNGAISTGFDEVSYPRPAASGPKCRLIRVELESRGRHGCCVGKTAEVVIKKIMGEMFSMLKKLAQRRRAAREASGAPEVPARWVDEPAGASDYDAHHAIVEGLERLNGAHAPASPAAYRALRVLEGEGLLLQERLVGQYLRCQDSLPFARQALWRESQMFWAQLTTAYLSLLRQVVRGSAREAFTPFMAEILARSLRYHARVMRWEYYRGQQPSSFAWRRLHKLWHIAEIRGLAARPVADGEGATTCGREYALPLILGLANPAGFKPAEVEHFAAALSRLPALPVPESHYRHGCHRHGVDLASGLGAVPVATGFSPARRMRFLDVQGVVDALAQPDAMPALSEILRTQLLRLLERGGVSRNTPRVAREGRIWVVRGMAAVLATAGAEAAAGEPWLMRDESRDGLGLVLVGGEGLADGEMFLVNDRSPLEHAWRLMVLRWQRQEGERFLGGAQCLSRYPKRVRVVWPEGEAAPVAEPCFALFLPSPDPGQGASHLLLPRAAYENGVQIVLLDGEVIYRVRLGEVAEEHGDWLRVDFLVAARQVVSAAA